MSVSSRPMSAPNVRKTAGLTFLPHRCNGALLEDSALLLDSTSMDSPVASCILHAAGVLQDAALPNQSAAKLRAVMAAKAMAVTNVSEAAYPLQASVLFSSIASFMGSQGQTNYSAANAALDSMAGDMQRKGQSGVSVMWGPWSGGGMASDATRARVQRMGMDLLSPQQGLGVLHSLLCTVQPPVAVLANNFSWPRFLQAAVGPDQGLQRLYGAFSDGSMAAVHSPTGASPAAGQSVSVTELQAVAADVIGAAVDVDQPLMAAG